MNKCLTQELYFAHFFLYDFSETESLENVNFLLFSALTANVKGVVKCPRCHLTSQVSIAVKS